METKKAISEVMAMLLMVVMTIGIFFAVWSFISGWFGRQTAAVLEFSQPSCNGTHILLQATNAGTQDLPLSNIRVLLGQQNKPAENLQFFDYTFSPPPLPSTSSVAAGKSFWIVISDPTITRGSTVRFVVTVPGKTQPFVVQC